jgi:hypothetical protein
MAQITANMEEKGVIAISSEHLLDEKPPARYPPVLVDQPLDQRIVLPTDDADVAAGPRSANRTTMTSVLWLCGTRTSALRSLRC